MNRELGHLFEMIEAQRAKLLSSLGGVPAGKLNFRPEGKWSINQIIAHLITAERMSVQYLSKKILGIEQAKDSGIYEELKMLLLTISQRLPLKFKAPKKVVELTPTATDLPTLAEEWRVVRADLKKILEQLSDQQVKRKIYKHVRVGMLDIRHALKFFGEHIIHHTPQIKKLL